MKRVVLAYLALMMASYAAAKDFPEGSGDIEIMEAGVYTASEDRTIASLNVATPTGTAEARTATVFDHTSCPERKITLNGAKDPQLNVANHYNTVWMKGGIWNFSGAIRLATEVSAASGKDAFRTLIVSDGAQVSGVTTAYISYKQGGSEMHVSNATFSAASLCVQGAASMTSDTAEKNRGKLIVGENGKVLLSGDLVVQEGTTTDNSRHTSLVRVSGTGAELSAVNVFMGDTPETRAVVGSQMFVENGASVTSTGDFRLGVSPYSYKPALFDVFQVSDSTFSGNNVYCGYGENVANERIVLANSTIAVAGELCAGYGVGSYTNFVGVYDCGTIEVASGKVWVSGRGSGSYGNTILISNTVVKTDQGVWAGSSGASSNNEVIVAGSSGQIEITARQRDPLRYGRGNRLRVTDQASLTVGTEVTSLWLFEESFGSEFIVEKGGCLAAPNGTSLTLTVGKAPKSGSGADNAVTVRDEGSLVLAGLNVGSTNNALVVDNAAASFSQAVFIGRAQDGLPAERCRVVVRGKSPKIDASHNFEFVNGSRSTLRFELPAGGYSWNDERTAPIVLSGGATRHLEISDDTVLEADVSALTNGERGRKIPLVSSVGTITMSETALANANEKGAAAKKPYSFSLSEDKMTLYLTAESRGCILVFR